jgi:hypothetical protein
MNAYNLLRLVQRHGSTLTLHKVAEGTYDPATGSLTGGSTTEYEITGYMYDAIEGTLDENNIRRATKKVIIPALGLTVVPDDGDYISGLGDKVHIVGVTTHYSSGLAVLYTCEVRE